MNLKESIKAIKENKPVECTLRTYKSTIRQGLADFANASFDKGEKALGMAATNEITRLNMFFRDQDDKALGEENNAQFLKEEND